VRTCIECRYLNTDQCGRLTNVAPLVSEVNRCHSWTSCDSVSDSAYLPFTRLPYNHNPQPGAIAPPSVRSPPPPEQPTTMTSSQQLVAPTWTKVSYKRGRPLPDDYERESKQTKDSQHWLHPPTTATSNRFLPLMETNNPESEHNPGPAHTPKPLSYLHKGCHLHPPTSPIAGRSCNTSIRNKSPRRQPGQSSTCDH
jgi:hypothetical protein